VCGGIQDRGCCAVVLEGSGGHLDT
jgi:hypothetical protein